MIHKDISTRLVTTSYSSNQLLFNLFSLFSLFNLCLNTSNTNSRSILQNGRFHLPPLLPSPSLREQHNFQHNRYSSSFYTELTEVGGPESTYIKPADGAKVGG
jgi:hypothetical protein